MAWQWTQSHTRTNKSGTGGSGRLNVHEKVHELTWRTRTPCRPVCRKMTRMNLSSLLWRKGQTSTARRCLTKNSHPVVSAWAKCPTQSGKKINIRLGSWYLLRYCFCNAKYTACSERVRITSTSLENTRFNKLTLFSAIMYWIDLDYILGRPPQQNYIIYAREHTV